MLLEGIHKDGIAINLHHDHDVLVAAFGYCWELTGMIGKHCVANVVYFSVYVVHLLASKCCYVLFLPRLSPGLGQPYIFPGFIQMPFWCLGGLWIILGCVAFSEHRPTFKVSSLDGLDPRGFDWIYTHCVHPFDFFFCCGQVVDAIFILEKIIEFLAWFPRFPLPLSYQRHMTATALITFSDENFLARDQNICLFVHLHFFVSENGDVAIIRRLSNDHHK